jgi:hypothetical protein
MLKGRVVDPDSIALWIQLQKPDPGSGSRGNKRRKITFLVYFFILITKRY